MKRNQLKGSLTKRNIKLESRESPDLVSQGASADPQSVTFAEWQANAVADPLGTSCAGEINTLGANAPMGGGPGSVSVAAVGLFYTGCIQAMVPAGTTYIGASGDFCATNIQWDNCLVFPAIDVADANSEEYSAVQQFTTQCGGRATSNP